MFRALLASLLNMNQIINQQTKKTASLKTTASLNDAKTAAAAVTFLLSSTVLIFTRQETNGTLNEQWYTAKAQENKLNVLSVKSLPTPLLRDGMFFFDPDLYVLWGGTHCIFYFFY